MEGTVRAGGQETAGHVWQGTHPVGRGPPLTSAEGIPDVNLISHFIRSIGSFLPGSHLPGMSSWCPSHVLSASQT